MANPRDSGRPEQIDRLEAVGLWDRPGIALARLLEMDLEASGRALVAPTTLAPKERISLVEQYLGKREAQSTHGKILSAITNPFVLLGAVLAIRYPVQSAANMYKLSKQLGGYDRYVGTIAKWVGSLEDTFRGTPIPNLFRGVARAVHNHQSRYLGEEAGGLTALLRKFEAQAGHKITSTERYRVAMKLDGLDQTTKGSMGAILSRQLGIPSVMKTIKLSRAERGLYDTLRKEWIPAHFTSLKAAGKAGYGGLRRDGIAIGEDLTELEMIEIYYPHLLAKRPAHELIAIARMQPKTAKKVTSIHAKDRHNAMLPSREEMEAFGRANPGQLNPKFQASLEREWKRRDSQFNLDPEAYSAPKEYTLDLVPTLEKYSNSVARVHGWNGHPARYGLAIEKELATARAAGPHGVVKANMLAETYIPMAKGQQTFAQSTKAAQWTSTKAMAVERLNSPLLKKVLPDTWRKRLTGMLETPTFDSSNTLGAAGANLFYMSALGGNTSFALANLTQAVLTTVPTIGLRWTGRGMESTFKKGAQYFRLRAKGLESDTAMRKAFPEFYEAGLTKVSTVFEGVGPELDSIWKAGRGGGGGLKGQLAKAQTAMMALMTGTEKFNRLTAFEGARLKGLFEGLQRSATLDFGTEIMERTQFAPTLTGIPRGLIGVNPLLKQFATFGTKYATLLAGNIGGALIGDVQRAGQLGRGLLTSGLIYEGGKQFLDTDVSRNLMWGALPGPFHDSPLGVIPFAPPALSIAASAVQSVLDEDLEPLRRQIPLMIPGGVAAARAVGPMAGRVLPGTVVKGISKFIGREYADYGRPTADGRYPVYDSKGRLKDSYTGLQLLMKAAGVPVGDMQRESEAMGYLLKHREQVRDAKRAWLEAYQNNDEPGQRAIAEDHKARFGFDIAIKKSDIQRVEMQRDVPRLDRMLKTLPRAARDQFGAIMGTAMSARPDPLLSALGGPQTPEGF